MFSGIGNQALSLVHCNKPVLRSIVEATLANGTRANERSIHIRADFVFIRFFVADEKGLARELLLLVDNRSVDLLDFLAFIFSLGAVVIEFDDFACFDVI